jgi:hypothetical protein
VEERASLKNPHITEVESSRYEDRILTVGDRISFADENPHITGNASSCYQDRILTVGNRVSLREKNPHITGIESSFYGDRILNGAGKSTILRILRLSSVFSNLLNPYLSHIFPLSFNLLSFPIHTLYFNLVVAYQCPNSIRSWRQQSTFFLNWRCMCVASVVLQKTELSFFNQDPDQSLWWKRERLGNCSRNIVEHFMGQKATGVLR